MRNKRIVKSGFVVVLLTFAFLVSMTSAQEAITVAGIDVAVNSGSLSYSVGQVVYQIHTGTGGSVTEGVQQSYLIRIAPKSKKNSDKYLSFTVFPNPAADFLDLKVENFNHENLSFQVVDINGRVLLNQRITASQTRFSMNELAPAVYYVQVMLDKKLVNTFKIIKY